MSFVRAEVEYFFGALRFFTRIPVPGWVGHSNEALNRATRYFPAVGLVVGALGAAVYWLAVQLWPPMVAVLLSMAATIYATGAFHEDGLADMVDGFGGGWDKMRILEIMKDSRIGSFGATVLVLALGGKWALLTSLPVASVPLALLAGHAVSRFASTCLIRALDYVREDALSKSKPLATRLSSGAFIVAAIFALLPLLWLPWQQALFACGLVLLATVWMARRFVRWLGGYTGDCLGATQQVSEIAFYLGLAANLG